MLFPRFLNVGYSHFLKPILFLIDPEWIHDRFSQIGELLENQSWLVKRLFQYEHPSLHRQILGINFANPIGLAAGFDYEGRMAKVMHQVGVGFNTIGTVTALPYSGNTKPRLARLPHSRSLLVNKGFKSSGAHAVRERLDKKDLRDTTVGISVGSSNLPQINTVTKAISDYLTTFRLFSHRKYVKYFELNISCPNTAVTGAFYDPQNFSKLCHALSSLKLRQPVFVKMPNEISFADSDTLVSIALRFGIRGFIFSNLVKDRHNPAFDPTEIASVSDLAGNFSGKPTFLNSNNLIAHTRQKFGQKIAIIGCGGIFSADDVREKMNAGADLVQLITGMIFEGPQLIGQINQQLAQDTF